MARDDRPLNPETLAAQDDADIDFSDQPETDAAFWVTARVMLPDERTTPIRSDNGDRGTAALGASTEGLTKGRAKPE